MGEVEEEQRSLLARGGDGGRSSKKDLLLPHTAADIVQSVSLSLSLCAVRPRPQTPQKQRFQSDYQQRERERDEDRELGLEVLEEFLGLDEPSCSGGLSLRSRT